MRRFTAQEIMEPVHIYRATRYGAHAAAKSAFGVKISDDHVHQKPTGLHRQSRTTHAQDLVKRTPSTSAIYETLRRSKELRESLSRPSSRLSVENIPDKMHKEPVRPESQCRDQYFEIGCLMVDGRWLMVKG